MEKLKELLRKYGWKILLLYVAQRLLRLAILGGVIAYYFKESQWIPVISFSQDDEEVNAGEVFKDGTIGLDDEGLYLETADCLYPGKWRLGGVADENTGDKNSKNTLYCSFCGKSQH